MKEKLMIRRPEVLNIFGSDADALIAAGDGDAALLYLYILRRGGVLDSRRAAGELGRSDRDIDAAVRRLREAGLLTGAAEQAVRAVPVPGDELPEYQAGDVAGRSEGEPQFRALVEDVQLALGRLLSSADLKKLFGIYDELALPPEVILLLVQYCKDEYANRYGQEKNVGFAFIEKEAYEWFHREIMTYEQAEQWLAELERRRSDIGFLRRRLGLADRPLTPTERKYLNEWLGLGFSAEAILIAADRTITNTNGLKWKYMDSIVRDWHRKGLHTPEEIEKGDKKSASRANRSGGASAPAPRDESKTMDQLRRLREKINSGGAG